jgi:predicted aconitase with swiveling domain
MPEFFQGRPVLPGDFTGEALVTRQGFNTLASCVVSLVLRRKVATCGDQNNPDLYKKVMTGKILCLPQTIGSTAGGLAIQTMARMGNGPLALLFSLPVDSLAAGGAILADIWVGKRIYVVDNLGEAFLARVKDGDRLHVFTDGRVEIAG